jgi:hypothetical protein
MRRTITGICVLLALAVAGCGSSSQAAGPAGGNGGSVAAATQATAGDVPEACSLLSKAEVEAAVGNPVTEGVPDILNSCKWETSGPATTSVGLHLLALPDGAECAVGRSGSTPVEGLGVPASWDFVEAADTGSVVACQAGWQIQVTLVGDIVSHTTTAATLRDAGVQLMGLVLPRM